MRVTASELAGVSKRRRLGASLPQRDRRESSEKQGCAFRRTAEGRGRLLAPTASNQLSRAPSALRFGQAPPRLFAFANVGKGLSKSAKGIRFWPA